MQWIIDLLIEKLRKDKDKEFEPEPLYIEDEYPTKRDDEPNDDKDKNNVIIIDL